MELGTLRRVGAAMLPVLLVGGLAACGQATPTAPAATSAPPASPSAPAAPPTTAAPAPVLNAAGYGALHLGMTRAQAIATGLTTGTTASATTGCGGAGDGYLTGSPKPDGEEIAGRLFFGGGGKLVAIYAYPGVRTPEGVTVGSTYAQLHAAYPAWKGMFEGKSGRGSLPLPGPAKSHYRIVVTNDSVLELSLDSNTQDCYE